MRPVAARNNTTLGALYTMLAMLGFASMDAISKWLVADYAIGQMMWIRYAVFCVFAWYVVRRRGLLTAARSRVGTARRGPSANRSTQRPIRSRARNLSRSPPWS